MTGFDDQNVYETKQGMTLPAGRNTESSPEIDYNDYDDGFDDAEADSDMNEPEEAEHKNTKETIFRRIFRIEFWKLTVLGNILSTIIGAILILGLVYLLVSMIKLVATDLGQIFSNL